MVAFFTTWASSPQMAEPLFKAVSGAAARYPDRYFALSAIATPGDAAALRGGRGRRCSRTRGARSSRSPRRCAPPSGSPNRRCRSRRCRPTCRRLPKGRIAEHEAKRILAEAGIPVLDEVLVDQRRRGRQAVGPQIGERLVLKIVSADIPHKTEMGGVMLDMPAGEAGAAFDRMIERIKERAPRATIDGVLISPMVRGGDRDDPRRAERSGVRPGRDARARRHLCRGIARRDVPHRAVRGRGGAPHDRRIARPGDARRRARPAALRYRRAGRRRCRSCRCSPPRNAPSSPASTSTRCWCARRARARRRSTR